MVKILNCYLYAKKSYGTLSKGAIFLAIPVGREIARNLRERLCHYYHLRHADRAALFCF